MVYPLGVVGCGEGVVYLTSPGIQLILAYSWARPAILVAGKDRGGIFFISSVNFPLYSLSFSFISSNVSSIFSLSLGDNTKWTTRVDVSLNPNTVNMVYLQMRHFFQLHRNIDIFFSYFSMTIFAVATIEVLQPYTLMSICNIHCIFPGEIKKIWSRASA